MSEEKCIRVYPDFGHPSSLWPSSSLILAVTDRAFYLPSDIGVTTELGSEILRWTSAFHRGFITESDDFDSPPVWKSDADRYGWYEWGYEIIRSLRQEFPGVKVTPHFASYVFSRNQILEAAGKPPVMLPGEYLAGHISLGELKNPSASPICSLTIFEYGDYLNDATTRGHTGISMSQTGNLVARAQPSEPPTGALNISGPMPQDKNPQFKVEYLRVRDRVGRSDHSIIDPEKIESSWAVEVNENLPTEPDALININSFIEGQCAQTSQISGKFKS